MAHPIDFYSPHASGDFLSQNLQFENDVKQTPKSIVTDRSHADEGVVFYQEEYTMEDDTRYIVTTSRLSPSIKRDASDIASLETSAWITKFGGLNKQRQIALARDFGMPSVFIGVQQNLDRFGNLDANTRNTLAIHTDVAKRFGHDVTNLVLNGISRGGMTALNTQATADLYGIHPIYTDSIVPCFPYGLNFKNDLRDGIKMLPNELNSIRALKLPFNILRHYFDTVDMSPRGAFQQLKEVPTLLAGQVGDSVLNDYDKDQFGYIMAYRGDIMSQGQRWYDLMQDRPHMIADLQSGGGHMSCISSDCYIAWRQRMEVISGLLHEDPSRRNLGGQALYNLAVDTSAIFDKSKYALAA